VTLSFLLFLLSVLWPSLFLFPAFQLSKSAWITEKTLRSLLICCCLKSSTSILQQIFSGFTCTWHILSYFVMLLRFRFSNWIDEWWCMVALALRRWLLSKSPEWRSHPRLVLCANSVRVGSSSDGGVENLPSGRKTDSCFSIARRIEFVVILIG
jgi:hypothetical protein